MNTETILNLRISQKYKPKAEKVRHRIQNQELFKYLKQLTNRDWEGGLEISHADLGNEVKWYPPNQIEIDFNNSAKRVVTGVIHEFVHLLLESPPWWENKKVQEVLETQANYRTPQLKFDFKYAVEQTLAVFLQAAAENKMDTRPLNWEDWQQIFKALDVEDVAQKLWPHWLEFLENPQDFDGWLAESLKEEFG